MKQLKFVVPGLLGTFANEIPLHIQQQLQLPEFTLINKLLSKADIENTNVDSYNATLIQLINPNCKQSISQLTAKYDGIDTAQDFFYRADPVHFKAESDHAILIGPDLVSPETKEAELLIASFNQHFSDDGLSLFSANSARWYIKSKKNLDLKFTALDDALGRDVKHFMPEGEDGLWWRKILNEMQMLFYMHEINQLRETQGKLTINGLWLWDQKIDFNVSNANPVDELFSDNVVAISLADGADIRVSSAEKIPNINSTAVLDIDLLYESVCYGDIEAWFSALSQFCNNELKLVSDLLLSKKIDQLSIYPCCGQVFNLNRQSFLKFWKKNKPLNTYMYPTG